MRRIAVAVVLLLLLSASVSADVSDVDGSQSIVKINGTRQTSHLAQRIGIRGVLDFLNQSGGWSGAKTDDKYTRLEAQSICSPYLSAYMAEADVTWEFSSSYSGPALIRPIGDITGTLATFGGGAGFGGAEAKVTFTVKDIFADETPIRQTLYNGKSPVVYEWLTKGKPLKESIDELGLGGYHALELVAGHRYAATVKLETSCWSRGQYTVRVDYSRNAAPFKQIGMVRVARIDIRPMRGVGE